jgi:hypothetical protein
MDTHLHDTMAHILSSLAEHDSFAPHACALNSAGGLDGLAVEAGPTRGVVVERNGRVREVIEWTPQPYARPAVASSLAPLTLTIPRHEPQLDFSDAEVAP